MRDSAIGLDDGWCGREGEKEERLMLKMLNERDKLIQKRNEAFCSFEQCVKLKNAGFPQHGTDYYYTLDGSAIIGEMRRLDKVVRRVTGTEILEEIRQTKKARITITIYNNDGMGTCWYVGVGNQISSSAILNAALVEAWCKQKGAEE